MKKFCFKTVVWREGKHYVAQCLNVDISSFGKSKKDALANLSEALELYFEGAKSYKYSEIKQPELVNLCPRYV